MRSSCGEAAACRPRASCPFGQSSFGDLLTGAVTQLQGFAVP
jgi:hypothetical protein